MTLNSVWFIFQFSCDQLSYTTFSVFVDRIVKLFPIKQFEFQLNWKKECERRVPSEDDFMPCDLPNLRVENLCGPAFLWTSYGSRSRAGDRCYRCIDEL